MRDLVKLAAIAVALALTGCGAVTATTSSPTGSVAPAISTTAPTSTATAIATATATTTAPKYPAACAAITLGKASEWAQAEQHWLTAEEQASAGGNFTATLKLENLVADTGALAMDTLNGTSSAVDLFTYQADLTSASAYTAHC